MRQSRVVRRDRGARASGPMLAQPTPQFKHPSPRISKPLATPHPSPRGVAYRFAHPPSAETTLVWVVDGRKPWAWKDDLSPTRGSVGVGASRSQCELALLPPWTSGFEQTVT